MKKCHFRFWLGFAFSVAGCSSTPLPTLETPQPLTLGVQSSKPAQTYEVWLPLVEDMSKKWNRPIRLQTASQSEVVKGLKEGTIDVAWLSSSAAVDAVAQAQAEVFARYTNVNGSDGYQAILLTRKDTGIHTVEAALTPGKYRYGSGPKTSTSGYVLPQYFLFSPRQTTPEATFKSVSYGGHFDNLEALWAKKLDVIINNSTDTAVFERRTPGSAENLVVLWSSITVPNDVLMARKGLGTEQIQQMKVFVTEKYGQTEDEQKYYQQASGILRFTPADNRLLIPVSELKFGTDREAIEQNAQLSSSEKAIQRERLEADRAQFKRLSTQE